MLRASSLGLSLPAFTAPPPLSCHSLFRPLVLLRTSSTATVRLARDYDSSSSEAESLPAKDESVEVDAIVTQKPGYPAGRPWKDPPVKPIVSPRPASAAKRNFVRRVLVPPVAYRLTLPPPPSPRIANNTATRPASSSEVDANIPQSITTCANQDNLGPDAENRAMHRGLLRVLALSNSAEEAWEAYNKLLAIPRSEGAPVGKQLIPFSHLHRLSRLIAKTRPKTRDTFHRQLHVMHTLLRFGGNLHVHQWNTLIHNAGRGLRRTRPADYELALDIHNDMIARRAPAATFLGLDQAFDPEVDRSAVAPDIYTYTSLINIAARTGHSPSIRQAAGSLHASGLRPNRISHLSMLRYFTHTKQLSGVRSTIMKMKQQGLELGLDGINACIWAYAHMERVDVAAMIYRLLRHNNIPDTRSSEESIVSVMHYLREAEGIVIPEDMIPNEVTYTLMIQLHAYHGDLGAALSVFSEMLNSPNLEVGAPVITDEAGGLQPSNYSITLPIFRAIFLGFSRHGISPSDEPSQDSSLFPRLPARSTKWDLENLRLLFDAFLTLPAHTGLGPSVTYWIFQGFAKTSGNNRQVLRDVWMQLEARFDLYQGGKENRLRRLKESIFDENDDEPLKPDILEK